LVPRLAKSKAAGQRRSVNTAPQCSAAPRELGVIPPRAPFGKARGFFCSRGGFFRNRMGRAWRRMGQRPPGNPSCSRKNELANIGFCFRAPAFELNELLDKGLAVSWPSFVVGLEITGAGRPAVLSWPWAYLSPGRKTWGLWSPRCKLGHFSRSVNDKKDPLGRAEMGGFARLPNFAQAA